jgi:hypothetical protein
MSLKHKRSNKPPKSGTKQLLKWLDSFDKVSAAVEKHGDLQQLLEQGGGIVKVENFLPTFVAEGIYHLLEQFSEADWNVGGRRAYACPVLSLSHTPRQQRGQLHHAVAHNPSPLPCCTLLNTHSISTSAGHCC